MANPLDPPGVTAQVELAGDVDVLFVGAGVSTSYTLLSMLDELRRNPADRPVRVAVVEQASDLYGGQAYGLRSGYTSLLITSLKDFLPEAPRALFSAWLSKNKSWAFEKFRQFGGELSARWWERNSKAVEEDLWDDLYLPRYLFGLYIAESVQDSIADAKAAGLITHTTIQDEVATIQRQASSYQVVGRHTGMTAHARNVVLAVGSGPTISRFGASPSSDATEVGGTCLIEDLYVPSVTTNLDRVQRALRRCGDRKINVLIVGGNASTMEALYILNDTGFPELEEARFYVLSPSLSLPERLVDPTPSACFVPENLLELPARTELTARSVYDAALQDLAAGKVAGLTVSDTLVPISRAVISVLRLLSREEQLAFAGHWGAELGRHQRRAGNEYADVVTSLMSQGRLELVAGKFLEVAGINDAGAAFRYEVEGLARDFEQRMTVIVNCSGFRPLHELGEESLLDTMVRHGTCRPTQWGRGIVVNDDMEANDGLFVMGPLLAGNVIGGFPVWHVEHCGRISSFSATLGGTLAARVAAPGQ